MSENPTNEFEQDERCMAPMANPSMSRRGFFSLAAAVGALTFIGSVMTPRGSLVAAYADEEQRIHFSVYILGRDEVPILCYDVSDEDNKVAVEGMHIAITSLNNSLSVPAVTDKDGFATVNVKALSQQADDDTASAYSFYGTISASKDGYRQLHYPEYYITSNKHTSEEGVHTVAIEIPTHPVADGDLYLRTAALDNNDVQYCDAECYVGPTNTIDHTFDVEVIAPEN